MDKVIVFASNTAWSLFNFRLDLMESLKDSGYKVVALASKDQAVEKIEREFDFIPIKNLDRKGTNPIKDSALFFEYLRVYTKIKPHLVINFTIKPCIYSSLACRILGIPYVSTITGLGYVFVKGGLLKSLVVRMYKMALKNAYKVVFQNRDDMETFLKLNIVKEHQSILTHGSGVNTHRFSPDYCRDYPKAEVPTFLMVSRMLWDKGVNELVVAGKILKEKGLDFEIWLLGPVDKGNPSAVPEEKIREWESLGFVKYLGYTDDVRKYVCQSHCVVLPSYREGVPRALLEAMAMGKPIITTDAPGCRETCIDGVNGFLVKPRDVESLASAMERFLLLEDKEKERMGLEGRKLALEKFDVRHVIKIYEDIVRSLECAG